MSVVLELSRRLSTPAKVEFNRLEFSENWDLMRGFYFHRRCPAMLVFDKHSLRCVVPPTEECDIPSTPAPLEDQPDGQQADRGQVCSLPFLTMLVCNSLFILAAK